MDPRKRKIFDYVCSRGFAAPEELAAMLNVSPITIRRDFIWLEKAGSLKRVHGGAMLNDLPNAIKDVSSRALIAIKEKRAIASLAASMISPRDKIFLDCGSTCRFLADVIEEKPDLTVFTYSLDSMNAIASKANIRLIVPGGELHRNISAFAGQATEAALSSYHFDIAFLGTTGIDLARGLTDDSTAEGAIKHIAAMNSDRCVILADGSKLGKVAFRAFLKTDEIPLTLITDSNAPKHLCASLRKKGIALKIADMA